MSERYWRVRDRALEEAAEQCESSLRFHRQMQRDASTPDQREIHYRMAQEAERLVWDIRSRKVA